MGIVKLVYSIKKAYIKVTTSIAFYPTMIAFGMLALAWGSIVLDEGSTGVFLLEKAPFLKIDNADTARNLLSSLLTGLISLVTFTFTMVMVVLAQVTASYSPRLLPDLISKKGNQVVLGIIIGSICYLIVVLSNVETMTQGPKVPLFSVVVCEFLGIVSLFSFIYFIHKISNEIQIGNILNDRYRITRDVIDCEVESGTYYEHWEEEEKFFMVEAWDSGYFDVITRDHFEKASKKRGLKLRLLKNQGMYLLKGEPFLEINQPLDEEIKNILEENVMLRHQENLEVNFFFGFKQLTELAVKALSPAINDPGTAIQSIDYQSDLLCRLQALKGQKVIKHKDGTTCIIYAPVPYEKVFYLCTASIRAYSATDVTVQARLISLIKKLGLRDEEGKHHTLYEKALTSIEEASSQEMKSQQDIDFVQELVKDARECLRH